MKILWIDDDGRNLEVQKRALEKRGFDVEIHPEVDDAWKRIQALRNGPLHIILDIMMGTGELLIDRPTNGGLKTGEQFLIKLSEDNLLDQMKVFVYTIINDPSARETCERFNIRFYPKQLHPGRKLVDVAVTEFGEP